MRRFRKIKADPAKAADPRAVQAAAVALLGGRDYARRELLERLVVQGYDREVVSEAVSELVEGGVLNDARYAEQYVSYHADRGQGPVRIGGDLKALGLPGETIEAALASGPDWAALAREVRRRKFGAEPPESWKEKGRQSRFLQYRGFSSDHIRAALGGDFDPDQAS